MESGRPGESKTENLNEYWGTLLKHGAHFARYQDSRRSALDIIELALRGGCFLPQLTQEYVVEERKLYDTAVGHAVDESIAKAREDHERDLSRLRKEHKQALENADVQAKADLKALSLHAEAKLKVIVEETKQLRATRAEAQAKMDDLEIMTSVSDGDEQMSVSKTDDIDHDEHHPRQKRAFRWFGRFAAMSGAVILSVLTGGAMAPVGISLVSLMEAICQTDKDREAAKKYRHES